MKVLEKMDRKLDMEMKVLQMQLNRIAKTTGL
jgi:hypothetical protein